MARRVLVLALVLFVIVGMASAQVAEGPAAEGPSEDIGTMDANEDAAPVGGPVPAGAFPKTSFDTQSGSPGSSAASDLEVSTIAGFAVTAAGAAFLF